MRTAGPSPNPWPSVMSWAASSWAWTMKLTFSPTTNHTFKGAYTKIKSTEAGNSFSTIMDQASLVNRATPQDLLSANYTGIITSHFFVEAQYSRRRFTFVRAAAPAVPR